MRHVLGVVPSWPGLGAVKGIRRQGGRTRHGGLVHGAAGQEDISLAGGRFQSCLREIQKRACDFEDEKNGIRIKKEDWEKLHVHIASYSYFPIAASLASSAAGLACLGKHLFPFASQRDSEVSL